MTIKTVVVIGYREIDEIVNKNIPAFKGKFEFSDAMECCGGTALTCNGIDGNFKYLDKNSVIQKIESGICRYDAHGLLHYLCMKQLIPPGDYVIEEVSW